MDFYVALGSNIGDREQHLRSAVYEMDALAHTHITQLSVIYETDPVGNTDQDQFLNMVAIASSTLTVQDFFRHVMAIEIKLGRTREVHWGPRTIDLDLVMIDHLACRVNTPDIQVPHPRMMERLFVLMPLLDVLDQAHQDYHELSGIMRRFPDKKGIKPWITVDWLGVSGPSVN